MSTNSNTTLNRDELRSQKKGRPSVFETNEKILEELLTLPEGETLVIRFRSSAEAKSKRASLYYTFKKAAFNPGKYSRYAHLIHRFSLHHSEDRPNSLVITYNKPPIIRRIKEGN